MADYLVKEVRPATDKTPAVNEVTLLVKAVGEDGKEVVIRGNKFNATLSDIDKRIATLEAELAKWKAIKADMEK